MSKKWWKLQIWVKIMNSDLTFFKFLKNFWTFSKLWIRFLDISIVTNEKFSDKKLLQNYNWFSKKFRITDLDQLITTYPQPFLIAGYILDFGYRRAHHRCNFKGLPRQLQMLLINISYYILYEVAAGAVGTF